MELGQQVLHHVDSRFAEAFHLIAHSAGQLNTGQIWHRPSSSSNSVGIIIQHLTGNLHQWILDGLGGKEYHRNRPMEFKEGERAPQEKILPQFSQLGEKVHDVIVHTSPETLLEPRRIQGFDHTVLSALIAAVTHFELHAGQIAYISKLILNEKYQESWKPASPEQGSR